MRRRMSISLKVGQAKVRRERINFVHFVILFENSAVAVFFAVARLPTAHTHTYHISKWVQDAHMGNLCGEVSLKGFPRTQSCTHPLTQKQASGSQNRERGYDALPHRSPVSPVRGSKMKKLEFKMLGTCPNCGREHQRQFPADVW